MLTLQTTAVTSRQRIYHISTQHFHLDSNPPSMPYKNLSIAKNIKHEIVP